MVVGLSPDAFYQLFKYGDSESQIREQMSGPEIS